MIVGVFIFDREVNLSTINDKGREIAQKQALHIKIRATHIGGEIARAKGRDSPSNHCISQGGEEVKHPSKGKM